MRATISRSDGSAGIGAKTAVLYQVFLYLVYDTCN